jgi:hypothetical protein
LSHNPVCGSLSGVSDTRVEQFHPQHIHHDRMLGAF